MDLIQTIWLKILELLYPQICISCSQYLLPDEREKLLCNKCFDYIEILKENHLEYVHSISLYNSKPLRDLIHGLKFKRYANAMGQIEELIQKYLDKNPNSILKTYDLITFIPMHPKRQRVRGFNQAELIAKALGKRLGIKVLPILKKVKDIKEQSLIRDVGLREKNVRGCFELMDSVSRNIKIILVDDVYTSGATIKEAAIMLGQTNEREISIFALAKA